MLELKASITQDDAKSPWKCFVWPLIRLSYASSLIATSMTYILNIGCNCNKILPYRHTFVVLYALQCHLGVNTDFSHVSSPWFHHNTVTRTGYRGLPVGPLQSQLPTPVHGLTGKQEDISSDWVFIHCQPVKLVLRVRWWWQGHFNTIPCETSNHVHRWLSSMVITYHVAPVTINSL